MQLVEYLDKALESHFGILVGALWREEAVKLRRALYNERERQRKLGKTRYDRLSFVLEEAGNGLKIIRRDKVQPVFSGSGEVYTLKQKDLPSHIGARGQSLAFHGIS